MQREPVGLCHRGAKQSCRCNCNRRHQRLVVRGPASSTNSLTRGACESLGFPHGCLPLHARCNDKSPATIPVAARRCYRVKAQIQARALRLIVA